MQNRNVWAQRVLHMTACFIRLGILEGGLAKQESVGPYAVQLKGLCSSSKSACVLRIYLCTRLYTGFCALHAVRALDKSAR